LRKARCRDAQRLQESVTKYVDKVNASGCLRSGMHLVLKKISDSRSQSSTLVNRGGYTCVPVLRKRRAKGGRGVARALSVASRLAIAFSVEQRASTLAREHKCHVNTVRTNKLFIAGQFLSFQLSMLTALLAEAMQHPPNSVSITRKFDETRQKLKFRLHPDHAGVSESIEVCVITLRVIIAWHDRVAA